MIGCLRLELKASATICVRAFAPLSGQTNTVFHLLTMYLALHSFAMMSTELMFTTSLKEVLAASKAVVTSL